MRYTDIRSNAFKRDLANARYSLAHQGEEMFRVYSIKKNGEQAKRPQPNLNGRIDLPKAEAEEVATRMMRNNPGSKYVVVPA